MDTVTEVVVTVGAILVFMALLFGLAQWWNQTSKRARQQRLKKDQALKAKEAERVLRHKEKLALAENGLVTAQLELAELDENNGNLKEAAFWFEKAALQDSAKGIAGFVRVCDASATEIVTQDKYRYWRNALEASQGDEQAEYEQGVALFEGFGIRSNMDRGLALIEHAANRKCVRAQMFLADWYRSPENPFADPDKAKEWSLKVESHSIDLDEKN